MNTSNSTIYDNLIIDGNNLVYRAFYSKLPPKMLGDMNTTPIFKFLLMLKTIAHNYTPKKVYITWDKRINKSGHNFRKDLIDYKGQRVESDDSREIHKHIDYLEAFILALGITTIFPYNLEADDVICFLSKTLKGNNLIVSTDNDLLQLVDERTHIINGKKDGVITADNFEEMVGVKREVYIQYKAIIGDPSDNIDGLFKYGPVKAKKLAESGLEGATPEQMEIINRNIQVMDLSNGYLKSEEELYSYTKQMEKYENVQYNPAKLMDLFTAFDFKIFKRTMGQWTTFFGTVKKQKENNYDIDFESLLFDISL